MLRSIDNVKQGIIEPNTFITAQSSRRAYNLSLSKHRDVENVHSAGVNTLDIDSECRYLLSGCSDGSIYIHDTFNFTGSPSFTASAEQVVQRCHKYAHHYSVETIQWFPSDTGLFVSGSMDKHLKVWDSNCMRPVEDIDFKGYIFQLHMSPLTESNCLVAGNDHFIMLLHSSYSLSLGHSVILELTVAGSENQVRIVDLKSGSLSHELRGHESSVLTCRWSPSREFLLATGGCDGRIILWDVRSTNTILRVLDPANETKYVTSKHQKAPSSHTGCVNGLCFTRDGHYLVSLGTDDKARLWNMVTDRNENVDYGLIPNEIRKCIQFDVTQHAKPELIYIPSEGSILVYELLTGKQVKTLLGHYNLVNSCRFNIMNQELYSGGNDRSVLIWTADQMQSEAYEEYISAQGVNKVKVGDVTRDVWSSDEESD